MAEWLNSRTLLPWPRISPVRILGVDVAPLIRPCWGGIPHATTRRTHNYIPGALGKNKKVKFMFIFNHTQPVLFSDVISLWISFFCRTEGAICVPWTTPTTTCCPCGTGRRRKDWRMWRSLSKPEASCVIIFPFGASPSRRLPGRFHFSGSFWAPPSWRSPQAWHLHLWIPLTRPLPSWDATPRSWQGSSSLQHSCKACSLIVWQPFRFSFTPPFICSPFLSLIPPILSAHGVFALSRHWRWGIDAQSGRTKPRSWELRAEGEVSTASGAGPQRSGLGKAIQCRCCIPVPPGGLFLQSCRWPSLYYLWSILHTTSMSFPLSFFMFYSCLNLDWICFIELTSDFSSWHLLTLDNFTYLTLGLPLDPLTDLTLG